MTLPPRQSRRVLRPGERGRPLRVGLIGYGMAGRYFHAPLIDAEPGLSLAAVATSQKATVLIDHPGTVVSADPFELTSHPDIDLVVIASPNHTHAAFAEAAIRNGKGVVVDKPIASTASEAQAIVELAEKSNVFLSVFHNRRWDSDFLTIVDAMKRDAVGDILYLESRLERFEPELANNWRDGPGTGGGVWLDLGPHLVDQALVLFGLPDAVVGQFAIRRPSGATEDWAHVVLIYPNHRVVLHMDLLASEPGHRFVVHGTNGTLVKRSRDWQGRQLLNGMKPDADAWGEDPDRLIISRSGGHSNEVPAMKGDYRRYYAGVTAALMGKGQNPVTGFQALDTMMVLDAAAKSARLGRIVGLDKPD